MNTEQLPPRPKLVDDEAIILKFRSMISARYEYHSLSRRMELPSTITPEVIEDVKLYFLNYLYPKKKEREGLEYAFERLASYVRQPKKIFGIFGNLTGAIFKFGRHFVQALRAAFGAFNAFMGAKSFESKMVIIANRQGIMSPMSDQDFEDCMIELDRKELAAFIKDVVGLFRLMLNHALQQKTINILDNVIETMRRKPKTYPPEDLQGIQLGKDLLVAGQSIFSKYDEQTRDDIMKVVEINEKWYMNKVYDQAN